MFSITDGCLRNDGGESVGEKIIMPARHMEFEWHGNSTEFEDDLHTSC